MSYQVFARKYRPQAFDEVLGQEAIVRTLKNAIALDRLHHAYLFCGARGVGKTSLARIFAKSLNCQNGPTVTPCQQCTSCQNITKGVSLDVYEIDGASNTGIDNVRELRDQARYLPTEGKYKIYIIDEVHMLSEAAFNGLLKTMEEPPAHLIFIMATTEPHDIPATILSRCQRFDCTRFKTSDLEKHLNRILSQEGVSLPPESLQLVAQSADGSVRDALSLLDQVVSFCGAGAGVDQVAQLLGYSDRALVHDMLDSLTEGDLGRGLTVLKTLHEKGGDLKIFGESLLKLLRDTMVFAQAGAAHVEVSPSEVEKIQSHASKAATQHLLILFQILSRTVEELSRSEFPQLIFEVGLVKMIQARECLSIPQIIEQLNAGGTATPAGPDPQAPSRFQPRPPPQSSSSQNNLTVRPQAPLRNQSHPLTHSGYDGVQKQVVLPAPIKNQAHSAGEGEAPLALPVEGALLAPINDWYSFVAKVRSEKPQLGSLIDEAHPIEFRSGRIVLAFPSGSIHGDMLKDRKELLGTYLQSWFGSPGAIEIKSLSDGESAPETALRVREKRLSEKKAELKEEAMRNPVIQKAQEILGATLVDVREVK